jgi:hypothetical protein
LLRRVGYAAYLAALVVGSFLVFPVVEVATANHSADALTYGIVGAVALAGVAYLLPPRADFAAWKLRWLVPLGLALYVGAGLGIQAGRNDSALGGSLYSYCAYGSVSDAQLHGCIEHVNVRHIDDLDTNAARFSREQLTACLADAGPFCQHALDGQSIADQAPNGPGQ